MLKQSRISKPHSSVFRQFQQQDSLKMGELREKVFAVVLWDQTAVRRVAVPAAAEGFVDCY